ncbi:hypothetical protein DITRI_Ditri07aG0036400 [Diplodiscus trichospermus]
MSKRDETIIWWLLFVTCTAAFVQPGLAQLYPPWGLRPHLPGVLPPFPVDPAQVPKCWSALINIQRCLAEIYGTILKSPFLRIGPECCRTYKAVYDNCLPKIAFFPHFYNENCARFEVPPPTAN